MVNKKQIGPALVNTALQKLTMINPFYSNITIHNEWEDLSKQSDPVLWKLLTDKNAGESNDRDRTDSDDYIEGNAKFKEKKLKESSSPFPTVMCNERKLQENCNWEKSTTYISGSILYLTFPCQKS